ncbi:hypothetical protein WJX73_005389 [Symbiochloris irregularis]|uniref:Uncharacterized protein n=1 Tax=Symbiochloris irregularis TaxID=706552 RepID=A0AAW1PVY9_9CHLO
MKRSKLLESAVLVAQLDPSERSGSIRSYIGQAELSNQLIPHEGLDLSGVCSTPRFSGQRSLSCPCLFVL